MTGVNINSAVGNPIKNVIATNCDPDDENYSSKDCHILPPHLNSLFANQTGSRFQKEMADKGVNRKCAYLFEIQKAQVDLQWNYIKEVP